MQLNLLRAFLVVCEEGSITSAANRLHVGQPALTRQIASLEQEAGAKLLERTARGVVPTAAGKALADALARPLSEIETAIVTCRRFSRGQRSEVRIGYLQSLARSYLNPAVAAVRAAHPEVRVKLVDLCAGGQMRALEEGEIDVALMGHEGRLLPQRFYTRKIRSVGVVVAMPDDHPLAGQPAVEVGDLRHELFIGKEEKESPGYNDWIARICRGGGFRPRFVHQAETLAEMLSLTLSEGAVALLPEIVAEPSAPSVVVRPLAQAEATWDLMVVWQRGRLAAVVKTFLDALPSGPQRQKVLRAPATAAAI
jgi:DNA-binding transcriptional LysR family regulator